MGFGTSTAYLRDVTSHPVFGDGLMTIAVHCAAAAHPPTFLADGEWSSWPHPHRDIAVGRPVVVNDVEFLDDDLRRWYAVNAPQVGAEIALPVISDGKVIGVLGVTHREAHEWNPSEVRAMSSVAHMMGAAHTRIRAEQSLKEIVKAKDRFIASVSHELRTPMAVVMGLSSELNVRRAEFTEAEVSEFIDLIARQSREVAHIIEDLLVAARASASAITVIPEPMRLDDVVRDALATLATEHTRRIAALDLREVGTFADPLRVRQIIRNLVSNGHRHGGSRVFINVQATDGEAILDVIDDGPGIPAERRDAIFEAYAADSDFSGRTASIGLGLTVSRQLARLMGGDVVYLHEPLPTFRLLLPVGESPVGAEPTATLSRGMSPGDVQGR
jgi:signal transduction histidine kinase